MLNKFTGIITGSLLSISLINYLYKFDTNNIKFKDFKKYKGDEKEHEKEEKKYNNIGDFVL